jgi:hypothetical protein
MRMDETFTSPPASAITPEEWQQTPARVQIWIREVVAENKQLRETVEILQEFVNRNSQSSSQPPSQDRPDQKPAREPSGLPRKRGGQPGHRGHHRALVDEVDEVVIHKPTSCAGCGLMGRYRLRKRQVRHLLAECFGITMAASTVVNQQQVISQALAQPVADLQPM